MRVAILCSGNGGNLKAIHLFSQYIESQFNKRLEIFCLADRTCGATQYCHDSGIPFEISLHPRGNSANFIEILERINPELIVTNLHKILDKNFIAKYSRISYNLHYSLLPKYASMVGEEPIRCAYILDEFMGTTVHQVLEEVDAGPIFIQSRFRLGPENDFKDAKKICYRLGVLQLITLICSRLVSSPGDLAMVGVNSIDGMWVESSTNLFGFRADELFWFFERIQQI